MATINSGSIPLELPLWSVANFSRPKRVLSFPTRAWTIIFWIILRIVPYCLPGDELVPSVVIEGPVLKLSIILLLKNPLQLFTCLIGCQLLSSLRLCVRIILLHRKKRQVFLAPVKELTSSTVSYLQNTRAISDREILAERIRRARSWSPEACYRQMGSSNLSLNDKDREDMLERLVNLLFMIFYNKSSRRFTGER